MLQQFFSKQTFQKFFQEYNQCEFESRSGLIYCWVWSEFKLFAKVISRLAGKANLKNILVYCLKRVLKKKKRQKNVVFFMTDYHIMQVKSRAECSQGAFCTTFDLHLAPICLNDFCCVYLWAAVLGRFYCIVLLKAIKLNAKITLFTLDNSLSLQWNLKKKNSWLKN